MRLGRTAAASHTGRKRRRNEDSFVLEPPIFVVADGMGGARAGEIASGLAASAVRDEEEPSASPDERVLKLVREANRRVYKQASESDATKGMGTTITLALASPEGVVIGHVGDSRAYRFRAGELEQVTSDHSLVAELVRSGRLSPEDAEVHPQRSVITRALGTDPDVEVDVFRVPAERDDLFLLCSDGLTSMVDDGRIAALLGEQRGDLDKAAKALINEANKRGGEDNITVVLFEVAEADAAAAAPDEPIERATADQETLTEQDAVPAIASLAKTRSDADPWTEEPRVASAAPRRRRLPLALLVVVALLAALAAAGALALTRAHFVGAEKDGFVAVYQGVPYDIGWGVRLYRPVVVSGRLRAGQLTAAERRLLFNHDLVGRDTAVQRLHRMEQLVAPGSSSAASG